MRGQQAAGSWAPASATPPVHPTDTSTGEHQQQLARHGLEVAGPVTDALAAVELESTMLRYYCTKWHPLRQVLASLALPSPLHVPHDATCFEWLPCYHAGIRSSAGGHCNTVCMRESKTTWGEQVLTYRYMAWCCLCGRDMCKGLHVCSNFVLWRSLVSEAGLHLVPRGWACAAGWGMDLWELQPTELYARAPPHLVLTENDQHMP